jgi:dTDP-4-amino-4,6-dideoxygalactose transaminase
MSNKQQIHLSRPDITNLERQAVLEVLNTPNLSLGPTGPKFEAAFAEYVGAEHAVACNSGTSGLHLSLLANGIGAGDKVVTSPFSFIASANSIIMAGAEPVFVDIDENTLNITPEATQSIMEDSVRAILPVHIFGLVADMPGFAEVAKKHNLILIEDACEALGAEVNGRKTGAWSDAGVFAFYPNKQMTTGEGGMIVTPHEKVATLCRSLRNQGRSSGGGWLAHERLGFNYRLSDINSALGLAQLSRIDEILAKRARVAAWYNEALSSIDGVITPCGCADGERSWFVYVIRLVDERASERDRLLEYLTANGIGCSNYFPPIHLQPFYQERFNYREGQFPICERVSRSTIALPFHAELCEADVMRVAETLNQGLKVD